MSTNEKRNKPAAEKKELTPQQVQKRRKMLVFPILLLLFLGAMWLIFSPKGNKQDEQVDGLNTELPTPKENGIVGDKIDAYTQEEMQRKEREKVRSLQDFAFALGEENETPEQRIAHEQQKSQKPDGYYEDTQGFENSHTDSPNDRAFRASTDALAGINRELDNFYGETGEQEPSGLELRILELERKLAEEQAAKAAEDEQVRLIEKSYEIAARYANVNQQSPPDGEAPAATNAKKKVAVQPVSQVRRDVVYLLAAPLSDSEFMEEFVKPRNLGFNTVGAEDKVQERNSIRACVYRTVSVTDGQEVALRLLEPIRAGDFVIPVNTIVTGTARMGGERLAITVNAVQHEGNIIPIEIAVYDLDGNEGISVPGSEEINAVKEMAANMGSGMGSSITITDNAESQLLADLSRSAIQGLSQYAGKKMRTVKVTLKAGYRVLLMPPLE